MPDSFDLVLAVMTGGLLLAMAGLALVYARAWVKVEQGRALIVNRMGRIDVSFTAALVIPAVHRAEVIDITSKTLTIERRGKHAIICRDGIRADIRVTFYVRVNKTAEDIIKVAQSMGCAGASDQARLEELFTAKFSEALKTVAAHLEFEQMHAQRYEFKEEILQVVGADLDGFVLDDLAIDELEQTPIEQLDPNNILDAAGIRKIVERTTEEKRRREEIAFAAERQARAQRLQLEELVIELERRKADMLGRFREATGRELDQEALAERIDERLRELVRPVVQHVVEEVVDQLVERALEERQGSAPARTGAR